MNQWSEKDEKNRTRDLIIAFVSLITLLVFMICFYTYTYDVYKYHHRTEMRIERTE